MHEIVGGCYVCVGGGGRGGWGRVGGGEGVRGGGRVGRGWGEGRGRLWNERVCVKS